MQTSEWIKFAYGTPEDGSGKVRLRQVTSPYDIPEAFRLTPLEKNRISIEFRYLDRAESSRLVHLSGDVKVEVGKSTMRLLAIEFRPGDHDVQELLPRLHRIIQQLSEKEGLRRQAEWNYRATREAVDQALPSVSDRLTNLLYPLPAH